MENKFKRFLSLALAVMMVISMMPSNIVFAATGDSSETAVYLAPGTDWPYDNAWYAAYYWDANSTGWTKLTDEDGDGYFKASIPAGYSNIIFTRMNPAYNEPGWEGVWNQTNDLTIPTDGSNCFVINNPWDNSDTGDWTAYTAVVAKNETTGAFYTDLASAVSAATAGDVIVLYADVDSVPAINKALTIKGGADGVAVNGAIAENFADIDGTVTFENLTFNERISTENASNDQSKLTLKFVGCTFNVPSANTYAIQAGASWNNDLLGALVVENCTFKAEADSFVKGYMVYAQCVENVTVTGSTLDGNNAFRGAIHLGDSTVYATTASIEGNTIKNFARGVQVGNRVEGSVLTVDGNTFENIAAIEGETESATVYIHEVADAETTDIVYTNNEVGDSLVIFSENATGAVTDFVTSFEGNTKNDAAIELEGNYDDTVYVEPTYVAVINGTGYPTLAEAITAANGMTGDVTVEIYGKAEYTAATADLTGAYDSISFVGKTDDAEISITRDGSNGYISGSNQGNDCTVNFSDLILSKPTGSYANDAGFMNVYFTVYRVGEVNYTNCTFPDGACAQGCAATYTDCEFANQTSGEYSLWVYANTTVTVEGGTFTGVRGVKMYAEGAAKTGNLVMKNTVFTESVTQKPAIVLTYGESVTLEGNTYPATGVFELDADGAPNGTTVTADIADIDCKSDNYDDCGVLVDGKIYTTVTDAAAVAAEGSTVTLFYDPTETVELAEGVTLNKNGYTAANVTVAVPEPAGTLGTGVVFNKGDEGAADGSYIYFDISGLYATTSIEIKLYSGETLLSTTVLNQTGIDRGYLALSNLSAKVEITDDSSSWDTTWAVGPVADLVPDKATLYVDGNEMNSVGVNMYNTDYPDQAREWADIEGVNPDYVAYVGETGYKTLVEALGTANPGSTIVVKKDVTEAIEDMMWMTITTDNPDGVTITNTLEDYIYMEDLTIGKGVTVKSNGIFFQDGDNTVYGTVEVIPPDGIYYQGYDAKVTVKDGGKIIVDGSTILRYNTAADAGLYIYGDGDDSTVEFSTSYYIGAYSGTFYAENATVKSGYFLLKNSYDDSSYAGVDLELNNSTLEVIGTSDGQKHFITDDDASITLTNGSSLVIPGDFNAAESVVLSVDSTSSIAAANFATVATYEELVAALNAGKDVVLTADITCTGEINGTDANIDLNGKKLTLTVGGTNFFGESTIENGTIDITGCVASGDCIIGIGDYSNDATLNLNNVNVTGDGYSSAYAVLYVYGSSTLNINGGSVVVSNDTASAGGVIKAHSAANGKINITGTESDPVELTFNDAKIGILDGTVVLDYVDLDITGGANGINQSALTVKNSTLTIKNCDGRALTLNDGDVTIENSTLDFSGATEGEIRFKKGLTLNVDENSTIVSCDIWTDAEGANVNGIAVIGTEDEMSTVTVADGTTTIKNPVTGLSGSGTEADPYLITCLEELIWFRDDVNTYTSDRSNQYVGKYVKLTADIDLDGINWEPIGTNSVGDHMAFLGTFDGGGHTISNLYINSDGDYLGFFARTGSYIESEQAVVKNLTFHNVDVSSNSTTSHDGSYVGGVIANAGGNTVVSNVHLTGYIYVAGYGYVGGIVGHGYPDITDCSVKAEDGSYVHAYYWCAGGVIGYAGEGGTPITNTSVSGIDVWSAYGAAAAVAGLLQDGNTLTNVSASNVSVTSSSDYVMGYIAGNGEASTMTNVTTENVTATANGKVITSTDAVAQIGNAIYFDLQSAVDAVEDGETIMLLRDVTVSGVANAVNVTRGVSFTLDFNGKTLNANTTNAGVRININNDTVTAPVEVNLQNGTINAASSAYCAVIASGKSEDVALTVNIKDMTMTNCHTYGFNVKAFPYATVNVLDGTEIISTDGQGGVYALDDAVINVYEGAKITQKDTENTYMGANIGVAGTGVVNVKGGTFISDKYNANVMSSGGTLNISGGTFESTVYGIHVDSWATTIAGPSVANISGGTFTAPTVIWVGAYAGEQYSATANISGGTFNGKLDATYGGAESTIAATGGTYDQPVAEEYCAEGYMSVDNGDGTWTVELEVQLFNITSSNMILGNELAMNFFVTNTGAETEDYVAVVTMTFADGREDRVVEVPFAEWNEANNNRKKIPFTGIAAKEMSDNINVVIKDATTGAVVSNSYNDSVRDYALRGLSSGKIDAKTGTMLVEMLNYGAAAQGMFEYNESDLANRYIDAYQDAYALEEITMTNNLEQGTDYRSASLTLADKISMTMVFEKGTITQDMSAVVTFTDHYGVEKTVQIPGSEFTDRGDAWGIVVNELVVADGRQMVTCTILDADGNEIDGMYGVDSVESFCARAYESTGDAYYQAIMKFSQAAYNYLPR